MEETKTFSIDEIQEKNVKDTLKEVAEILESRGYDAKNQIVGYLLSGDPGYISSHKEARNKIVKLERTKIIEVLVKEFLK